LIPFQKFHYIKVRGFFAFFNFIYLFFYFFFCFCCFLFSFRSHGFTGTICRFALNDTKVSHWKFHDHRCMNTYENVSEFKFSQLSWINIEFCLGRWYGDVDGSFKYLPRTGSMSLQHLNFVVFGRSLKMENVRLQHNCICAWMTWLKSLYNLYTWQSLRHKLLYYVVYTKWIKVNVRFLFVVW
jgi:hypothetical protein